MDQNRRPSFLTLLLVLSVHLTAVRSEHFEYVKRVQLENGDTECVRVKIENGEKRITITKNDVQFTVVRQINEGSVLNQVSSEEMEDLLSRIRDSMLGDRCTADNDCKIKNSECRHERCSCVKHYKERNKICIEKHAKHDDKKRTLVPLGTFCETHDDCSYKNSICKDNKCICDDNFVPDYYRCIERLYEDSTTTETSTTTLDDTISDLKICTSDDDCLSNFKCEDRRCTCRKDCYIEEALGLKDVENDADGNKLEEEEQGDANNVVETNDEKDKKQEKGERDKEEKDKDEDRLEEDEDKGSLKDNGERKEGNVEDKEKQKEAVKEKDGDLEETEIELNKKETMDKNGSELQLPEVVTPAVFELLDKEKISALLGLSCHDDDDCPSEHADCYTGQCICEDGYAAEGHLCVSTCREENSLQTALIVVGCLIIVGLFSAACCFYIKRKRSQKRSRRHSNPTVEMHVARPENGSPSQEVVIAVRSDVCTAATQQAEFPVVLSVEDKPPSYEESVKYTTTSEKPKHLPSIPEKCERYPSSEMSSTALDIEPAVASAPPEKKHTSSMKF